MRGFLYIPNRNDRQEKNHLFNSLFSVFKRFYFLLLLNTHDVLLCLPSGIMENSVNCFGKVMEFYYQISVGTLYRRSSFGLVMDVIVLLS